MGFTFDMKVDGNVYSRLIESYSTKHPPNCFCIFQPERLALMSWVAAELFARLSAATSRSELGGRGGGGGKQLPIHSLK